MFCAGLQCLDDLGFGYRVLYGKLEVRAYDWAESGLDVVYGTTRSATLVLNETLRVCPMPSLHRLTGPAGDEGVWVQGRTCAKVSVCLSFPFVIEVMGSEKTPLPLLSVCACVSVCVRVRARVCAMCVCVCLRVDVRVFCGLLSCVVDDVKSMVEKE